MLNERRLGLIAATVPSLPRHERLPSWVDPAMVQVALRGGSNLPKLYYQLQKKADPRRKRVGSGRAKGRRDSKEAATGVVRDEDVAKEEVESRDEGWGGGKEAEEFVADTDVGDGAEKQKA